MARLWNTVSFTLIYESCFLIVDTELSRSQNSRPSEMTVFSFEDSIFTSFS